MSNVFDDRWYIFSKRKGETNEEFEKLDAQIIGVSTDSMETHNKFSAENGIEFPLITDEDKTIKKLYGRGRVTYLRAAARNNYTFCLSFGPSTALHPPTQIPICIGGCAL